MRIIYLTWGETPRSYGVFGSQVIGQFTETANLLPESKFYFISAVPVIHSGLVREKWRYARELKLVKHKLGVINFHWLPIWAPQNLINSSKFTFKFMHGLAHRHLNKKLQMIKPDVVHCRSYHAAWAALCIKKKYQLNYKIVFDGRGLWPEEVSLKRGWSDQSPNYKFLKTIEGILLTECEKSITVSDTMHEHYVKLKGINDSTIYLSADTKQLKFEKNEFEQSDTIRFCYVGALSDTTWHQPKTLISLYRYLRRLFPKTKLTVVTTSNHSELQSLFSEFPEEEVKFTSTKTRAELNQVLNSQDFGLMTYFTPKTEKEILLANMVLAVKSAEYLIAGLPMICNKYCGGIASILKNNNMGIVYDPNTYKGLDLISIESFMKLERKLEISNEAKLLFGSEDNAILCANIYKLLTNDK